MFKHVVVDVEIIKTIEETPGGWNATDQLGVAVACVWRYWDQRMRVYGPEDVEELQQSLMEADRITGFNILNFDFPVIWGIAKKDWQSHPTRNSLLLRTDDILRRIWQALGLDPESFSGLHKGWNLDAVAGSTLQARKIGHGAEAPKWFQAGLVQKVTNYCADDVALERDLCDFIESYGYVTRTDGSRIIRVALPRWTGGK